MKRLFVFFSLLVLLLGAAPDSGFRGGIGGSAGSVVYHAEMGGALLSGNSTTFTRADTNLSEVYDPSSVFDTSGDEVCYTGTTTIQDASIRVTFSEDTDAANLGSLAIGVGTTPVADLDEKGEIKDVFWYTNETDVTHEIVFDITQNDCVGLLFKVAATQQVKVVSGTLTIGGGGGGGGSTFIPDPDPSVDHSGFDTAVQGVAVGGDASGTVGAVVVTDDSHSHTLAGDVTGPVGATVVGDDSHDHTLSLAGDVTGTTAASVVGDDSHSHTDATVGVLALAGDVTGDTSASVVGDDSHTHTDTTLSDRVKQSGFGATPPTVYNAATKAACNGSAQEGDLCFVSGSKKIYKRVAAGSGIAAAHWSEIGEGFYVQCPDAAPNVGSPMSVLSDGTTSDEWPTAGLYLGSGSWGHYYPDGLAVQDCTSASSIVLVQTGGVFSYNTTGFTAGGVVCVNNAGALVDGGWDGCWDQSTQPTSVGIVLEVGVSGEIFIKPYQAHELSDRLMWLGYLVLDMKTDWGLPSDDPTLDSGSCVITEGGVGFGDEGIMCEGLGGNAFEHILIFPSTNADVTQTLPQGSGFVLVDPSPTNGGYCKANGTGGLVNCDATTIPETDLTFNTNDGSRHDHVEADVTDLHTPTPDQVGTVTNGQLCEGDAGSILSCDIATIADAQVPGGVTRDTESTIVCEPFEEVTPASTSYTFHWMGYDISVTDIFCAIDPTGGDTLDTMTLDLALCTAASNWETCTTAIENQITCDNDGQEDDGTINNPTVSTGDMIKVTWGTCGGGGSCDSVPWTLCYSRQVVE